MLRRLLVWTEEGASCSMALKGFIEGKLSNMIPIEKMMWRTRSLDSVCPPSSAAEIAGSVADMNESLERQRLVMQACSSWTIWMLYVELGFAGLVLYFIFALLQLPDSLVRILVWIARWLGSLWKSIGTA